MVISDEFWDIFDADGTNSLSMTEFMSAVSAFDQGYVYGMPWLVYSLGETEYLTDVYVDASSNSDHEYLAIATVPTSNISVPITSTAWQMWLSLIHI